MAFAALALAGCAPAVGGVERTSLAGRRPGLERDAFISFDGARLPMNVWAPQGAATSVIVALHGFDDYARAFEIAGPFWASRGAVTYAFDQRGFGRAPDRGSWVGPGPMIEDVRTLCALLRDRHPGLPLAVVGESMGGAVAITAFASGRPPSADRLVLLSPAVWGWSRQPVMNAVGLWLLDHVDPGLALAPPEALADQYRCSDNLKILRQMDADPNIINATRADATYGLVDLMEQASSQIAKLDIPTLYLYGAKDRLIPKSAAFAAAARLGPNGRTGYYADGWHLLDRDLEAPRVLEDALAFIRDPKAELPSRPPPIPAPDQLRA